MLEKMTGLGIEVRLSQLAGLTLGLDPPPMETRPHSNQLEFLAASAQCYAMRQPHCTRVPSLFYLANSKPQRLFSCISAT